MAKHRWSVVCHNASVDKYTNLMSILEVIDELTLAELEPLPDDGRDLAVPFQFCLVSVWDREDRGTPERFEEFVDIVTPDGRRHVGKSVLQGDLERARTTRLILRFDAVPYAGPGFYQFVICQGIAQSQEREEVSRVEFEIKSASSTSKA